MEKKLKIGATFSNHHLKYLNLDVDKALLEFKELNLKWMRVGCYWNEIEDKKGIYEFSEVEKIIEFCERNKINVVLTVGMKAPRWPEYYIPEWTNRRFRLLGVVRTSDRVFLKKTLNFIEETINKFKENKSIKVWQVENEPLDPSGDKKISISEKFLAKEIEVVRKIDKTRKVLVNVWGNKLYSRKNYLVAAKLGDIVGLDIYLKTPHYKIGIIKRFIGPYDSIDRIKKVSDSIRKLGKELWVTELQTEPWEDGLVTQKEFPQSFMPTDFEKNLKYSLEFEPSVILLWGFEYWFWRKENGNSLYWEKAKNVIAKYSNSI